MNNHIGGQLGDYRILAGVGGGGRGEVYLAEHVHLRKKYALKILPQELASDPGFVERFHAEARVMAELRHPHIVQVHYMGEHEGVYYLVMDYVTGPDGSPESLHQRLKREPDGRLPEAEARKWAVQVAEALAYAHDRGVVHRDLKPANILIDAEGDAKLTDFGLAKAIGSEFILSQEHGTIKQSPGKLPDVRAGEQPKVEDSLDTADTVTEEGLGADHRSGSLSRILGTYDYMAPEQRGEGDGRIDQRTDIYSFGVVLYRLLTGKRPAGMTKPPSQVVRGLSKRWDWIVARCLADDPAERWGCVEELLPHLRRTAARRGRSLAAVAIGLVVLCVAGLYYRSTQNPGELRETVNGWLDTVIAGLAQESKDDGSGWQPPPPLPPVPTGACCLDDNCLSATADDCAARQGKYLGDGSECDAEACAPPPAPRVAECIPYPRCDAGRCRERVRTGCHGGERRIHFGREH